MTFQISSKRNQFKLFLLSTIFCFLSTRNTAKANHADTIDSVSKLYLQSLVTTDQQEKNHNKQYQDKVDNNEIKIFDVQEIFTTVEKFKAAYDLHKLSTTTLDNSSEKTTTIEETTFSDLNLFCGDKHDVENHVFSQINKTITVSGTVALQSILASPINSIKKLQQRQNFVKALVKDEQLYQDLVRNLNKIREGEIEFLKITRAMQKEVEAYYNEIFFEARWLKPLNKNTIIMQPATYMLAGREFFRRVFLDFTLAGILGLTAPNGYKLQAFSEYYKLAYGFYAFMPVDPFLRVVSGVAGALNIFFAINELAMFNKRLPIVEQLKDKMAGIAQTLVTTHRELVQALVSMPDALEIFDEIAAQNIHEVESDPRKSVLSKLTHLHDNTLKTGLATATYNRKDEIKDNFADSYRLFGLVDAYVSIATLFKHHVECKKTSYSFVEYISAEKPMLVINDFWHPLLNDKSVVLNSISLGNPAPTNAFITGPNAGGKTTVLRTVGLCVIFSQTLGIAPAKKIQITPFSNIATYLNVADSEGKESLFQAEMRRAKSLLDKVKNLPLKDFNFAIIDELFTGTNPSEGAAAAYGVAKKLASYNNSMTLFTTHFIDLTRLAKETNMFTNFKVSVRKVGKKFEFPYKLEPGISDQTIALDLLGEDGFDEDIVSSAKEYLKSR